MFVLSVFANATGFAGDAEFADQDAPNILWITSEDNGSFLGCYGDAVADTPNLDRLASQGVRYTNFFANAPVCAVVRSSWILGLPSVSVGLHHMRSNYRVPKQLVTYPELLKQAGYYVTNNEKTDYNTRSFHKEIWDECGVQAHYKNRPKGTPFFAIFNIKLSHEGQIFEDLYPKKYPDPPKTPADGIKIPPYQVNTPEVVKDWQRMYDRIHDMDAEVGRLLKELEDSGQAENTIVFYCSDHGGILLRSKRFLHDSGTRVPFIIRVPDQWKELRDGEPNSVSQRLSQFIDLPRTFLSLTHADVPDRMNGKILLGKDQQAAPETVFLFSGRFDEAPDMSRGVTDGRWKYIRNFEPDRPRFQMLSYPLNQSGQLSQLNEYRAGNTTPAQSAQYLPQPPEELYDTAADPDEVNNLVNSPEHAERLGSLRDRLNAHILAIRDLGFMPEPLMADIDADESTTIYKRGQSDDFYPLQRVLDVATIASQQNEKNIPQLQQALKDPNEVVRYWGAAGLRILGENAAPAKSEIETALEDTSSSVRINAMISLGKIGQREKAIKHLIREAANTKTDAHALWALDGLRLLNAPEAAPEAVLKLKRGDAVRGAYSRRLFEDLKKQAASHK